jgi:hypothetical protein
MYHDTAYDDLVFILPPHDRHYYPNAEARFPALKELPYLQPGKALLLSAGICELHFEIRRL